VNPSKPTALKVLHGTTRKDRANPAEPQPAPGSQPLTLLSPEARRVWKKLAPMLTRLGLLGETDAISLELLCQTYVDWHRHRKGKSYHDQAAADRNRETLLKLLDRFGMNPSARTRVQVRKGENVDPIEQWADAK
jgi:phage terminase small subunit